LDHPFDTVGIIVQTTISQFTYYFTSMMGSMLGWLSIPVSYAIIVGLSACLLASCLHGYDAEAAAMPLRHRVLIALAVISVYVFFQIGMMVWWTPLGSGIIMGVQGRYFIPVLPLALFAVFRFKKNETPKSFHLYAAMGAVAFTLSAFSNILAVILQP
jgi:Predicted membrane protein (DUF2142).